MTENPTWHDTTREAGTLKIENKVYTFDGKKTTNTKELDKWLGKEYLKSGDLQRKTIEGDTKVKSMNAFGYEYCKSLEVLKQKGGEE